MEEIKLPILQRLTEGGICENVINRIFRNVRQCSMGLARYDAVVLSGAESKAAERLLLSPENMERVFLDL